MLLVDLGVCVHHGELLEGSRNPLEDAPLPLGVLPEGLGVEAHPNHALAGSWQVAGVVFLADLPKRRDQLALQEVQHLLRVRGVSPVQLNDLVEPSVHLDDGSVLLLQEEERAHLPAIVGELAKNLLQGLATPRYEEGQRLPRAQRSLHCRLRGQGHQRWAAVLLNPSDNAGVAAAAAVLLRVAALEEVQGRIPFDPILLCQADFGGGVHLRKLHAALQRDCGLLKLRRQLLAVAAPGGVELHQKQRVGPDRRSKGRLTELEDGAAGRGGKWQEQGGEAAECRWPRRPAHLRREGCRPARGKACHGGGPRARGQRP
mmetsp:Transcript_85961/g.228478  ORF Transcript_85961/g.228478 Transcript_85961/m.228478 type:complete len:316 (+) Transcript_85961:309-1256(+)